MKNPPAYARIKRTQATGATYVAQEVGIALETVTPEMLGTCERIVVGKEETTIITDGTQAEAIAKRITQIRREAESSDSQFDKEKAEERVAALGGGIARIKVGAATETELRDKKLRYEDAFECGVSNHGLRFAYFARRLRIKLSLVSGAFRRDERERVLQLYSSTRVP